MTSIRSGMSGISCRLGRITWTISSLMRKKLIEAGPSLKNAGIDIEIGSDSHCAEQIAQRFERLHGTKELGELAEIRGRIYPILLGSQDCFNICIGDSAEVILQLDIVGGIVRVFANIFDDQGRRQIEIRPGKKTNFLSSLGSVRGFSGGPIQIGTSNWSNIGIYVGNRCVLAGQLLSSNIVQFHYACLYNGAGQRALGIDRDQVTQSGLVMINNR